MDPPAAPGARAPQLWVDPAGTTALLSWIEGNTLRFSELRDGRWKPARSIAQRDDFFVNWADLPSVRRGESGALLAQWLQRSADGKYTYDVVLARSADDGAHWTLLGSPHKDGVKAEHGFFSAAREGTGWRAIWLDGRATAGGHAHGHAGGAMALRSAHIGATLGSESVVDARVCDCCSTDSVAVGDAVVVAYRDRSDEELRDIATARFVGGRWSKPRVVARDGWEIAGCPVNGPALATRDGALSVAWFTGAAPRPRVQVAFSGDQGRSFSPPRQITPGGTLGRVDVVMLEGGEAAVSWLEPAPGEGAARWRVRRVAADGRRGPALTLGKTSAARASGFLKLGRLGETLLAVWPEAGASGRLRARRLAISELPALETVAPAKPKKVEPARTLRARDFAGKTVTLQSLRGAPVLIELWATWCAPCRAALPALAELAQRWRPRGLRVVALNVDEGVGAAQRFVQALNVELRCWHDAFGGAAAALGYSALPTTVLLDAQGRIVWRHSGAWGEKRAELEAAIARSLQPR